MKNNKKSILGFSVCGAFVFLFVLLVVLLLSCDRQPIGLVGSEVGLATLNEKVFRFIGTDELWHRVSEISGSLCLLAAALAAMYGLYSATRSLYSKKSIYGINTDVLVLGGVYFLMLVLYVAFDKLLILNYRPVMPEGVLEASFPSTHTMFSICIAGCSSFFICQNIKNLIVRICAPSLLVLISIATIVSRLLSGVHWLTDIIGGILIGGALVALYYGASKLDFWKKISDKANLKSERN